MREAKQNIKLRKNNEIRGRENKLICFHGNSKTAGIR